MCTVLWLGFLSTSLDSAKQVSAGTRDGTHPAWATPACCGSSLRDQAPRNKDKKGCFKCFLEQKWHYVYSAIPPSPENFAQWKFSTWESKINKHIPIRFSLFFFFFWLNRGWFCFCSILHGKKASLPHCPVSQSSQKSALFPARKHEK